MRSHQIRCAIVDADGTERIPKLMTHAAPESAPSTTIRIPSIAILGADAVLAALPATPVQLAHACMLAGYHGVVPASWGDELIAVASLRVLERHGQSPAVQCSCPFVAHRLLAAGTDLRPFLVSLVSPPVAAARYLRAAHAPGKLRITYVGRCPGAADEVIDARLTPEELLAILADHRIAVEEQPRVFDSVIPPDRRRYRSQPGGLPTPEMLWSSIGAAGANQRRTLVELQGDALSVELAQHLLAGKAVLIDVATSVGCVCSGAIPGAEPSEARARVVALEPPRSPSPIVDEHVPVELELPLPASPRSVADVISPGAGSAARGAPPHRAVAADILAPEPAQAVERAALESPRREAPGVDEHTHTGPCPPHADVPLAAMSRERARPIAGAFPTSRTAAGRQLPRTYVARRKPSARDGHLSTLEARPADVPAPAEETSAADLPRATRVEAVADVVPPPVEARVEAIAIERPAPVPVHDELEITTNAPYEEPPNAPTPPAAEHATAAASSVIGLVAMPSPVPSERAAAPAMGLAPPAAAGFATAPGVPRGGAEVLESPRPRERSADVPFAPHSDAFARDRSHAPHARAERRVFSSVSAVVLLIVTIVLISAAVGVWVGRWMTQH